MPEAVALVIDGKKHFIQMPLGPVPGLPTAELSGEALAKHQAPLAYRLVEQDDTTDSISSSTS